jgi:hypothetical protein
MRALKMFGFACVLAAGAFVLTVMKDPAPSIAGHPGVVTVKSAGVQVPADLPALDCLTASTACP